MSAAPETRFRDFRPGRDDADAEALWDRCFGPARGGQTLTWLFRDGPAGACPRSVAENEAGVVAHAGVAALRFQVEGDTAIGGYSVGAMTDPAQQGRGLYVRTAEHLYDRLAREGYGLVAGFSNANSHRLHVERLGRAPIQPFPWCVRILRPVGAGLAILRGLFGAAAAAPPAVEAGELESEDLRARPVAFEEPRLDALWDRARGEIRVGAVRDSAYAAWRYGSRRDAGYRAWLVCRGEEPLAWAVGRMLSLRGLAAGFLTELLVAPDEDSAGRLAVAAFEAWALACGGQIGSALRPAAGTTGRVLRGAGYRQVPERMHPQVIRLSVLGLGPLAGSLVLADPDAWWLSWGDTDVI